MVVVELDMMAGLSRRDETGDQSRSIPAGAGNPLEVLVSAETKRRHPIGGWSDPREGYDPA